MSTNQGYRDTVIQEIEGWMNRIARDGTIPDEEFDALGTRDQLVYTVALTADFIAKLDRNGEEQEGDTNG